MHLLPVVLGRDLGTQIEVTSGLRPGSRVIDSPPDSILDGQQVRVAAQMPPSKEAAQTPSSGKPSGTPPPSPPR